MPAPYGQPAPSPFLRNGTAITNNSATGSVTVTPVSDSTSVLQVKRQTSGNPVFTVDTTDSTTIFQAKQDNTVKSSQLLVSKAFNNATYWTLGTGWVGGSTSATATAATGTVTATAANFTPVIGTSYYVSLSVTVTSGGITISVGNISYQEILATTTTVVQIPFFFVGTTTALTFTPDVTNGFTGIINMGALISGVFSIATVPPILQGNDSSGNLNMEARFSSANNINTGIGIGAQQFQTTATTQGVAIGFHAGQFDAGQGNLSIGYFAHNHLTVAGNNTAIGWQAGQNLVTGSNNTAIGPQTLSSNIKGSNNMALGLQALEFLQTGNNNFAAGTSAGTNITTGSGNTFLGFNTGTTTTTGSNNLLIGPSLTTPTATTSNYLSIGGVYIGNTSTFAATTKNNTLDDGTSGNMSLKGKVTTYNNVTTAALGHPAIYGSGRSTAQTGAVASVATYTVGASDGSFIISANANVTAFVAGTFNVNVAYTDETNTARTLNLSFSSLTGTLGIAIAAAGPFEGVPAHIRALASTTITVSTSGTFTSLTYNVEGYITQIG